MSTDGRVLSVNVGGVREFEYLGRTAKSAIGKSPVEGRVAVRGVNLDGDDQADRRVHGGADKAVYAYAIEDLWWWEEQLGRSLEFGKFGENLTTEGLDINDACVGERWQVGTAVLEVSEPRNAPDYRHRSERISLLAGEQEKAMTRSKPCMNTGLSPQDSCASIRRSRRRRGSPRFRRLIAGS